MVAALYRPHRVVSEEAVASGGAASVKISAEPAEPSTMHAGETVRGVVNPSLGALIPSVGGVAEFVGEGR